MTRRSFFQWLGSLWALNIVQRPGPTNVTAENAKYLWSNCCHCEKRYLVDLESPWVEDFYFCGPDCARQTVRSGVDVRF